MNKNNKIDDLAPYGYPVYGIYYKSHGKWRHYKCKVFLNEIDAAIELMHRKCGGWYDIPQLKNRCEIRKLKWSTRSQKFVKI